MERHPGRFENLLQEPKKILDYVEEYEGLFYPEGRHQELGAAAYYLQRIQDRLSSRQQVNGNKHAETEVIDRYFEEMSGFLEQQGQLGTARAHAAYSAFDVVSRLTGPDGALDFLLSPVSDGIQTFIEFLLNTPSEYVFNSEEERRMHTKEYRGEIEQYLLNYIDSSN